MTIKPRSVLRPSLRTNLANEVRSEIIRGTLAPGEHLQEVALGKRFGVSRTPVREALLMLEREGFLRGTPSVGLFVREFSRDEITQVYPVVFALERLGAELARRPSAAEAHALEELNGRLDRSRTIPDVAERAFVRVECNNAWHSGIAELSGNAELVRLLHHLYLRMGRYALKYWVVRPDHEISTSEHRDIVSLLLAGDNEGAGALMVRHNESALERFFDALEEHFCK